MSTPEILRGALRAPIFVVPPPGPCSFDVTAASCAAGFLGVLRTTGFDPSALNEAIGALSVRLDTLFRARCWDTSERIAPFGVYVDGLLTTSMLQVVVGNHVPFLFIEGVNEEAFRAIDAYGGVAFSLARDLNDVQRAVALGAGGVLLATEGPRSKSPEFGAFAAVAMVREFWPGPMALASGITDGKGVRAAEVLGADFAVVGASFSETFEGNPSGVGLPTVREMANQWVEDYREALTRPQGPCCD